MITISIDDLPPAYGIEAPARDLRNAAQTNAAHSRRELSRTGKRGSFVPVCSMQLGLWICAVCCRLGKDLRQMMCPFNEVG